MILTEHRLGNTGFEGKGKDEKGFRNSLRRTDRFVCRLLKRTKEKENKFLHKMDLLDGVILSPTVCFRNLDKNKLLVLQM